MTAPVEEEQDIWIACPQCARHLQTAGHLIIGACSSVGIEEKMSTRQMALVYFDGYHSRHR